MEYKIDTKHLSKSLELITSKEFKQKPVKDTQLIFYNKPHHIKGENSTITKIEMKQNLNLSNFEVRVILERIHHG